ncbi:MAG: purine-binding chemotaxis protein CheW [Spirochaetaceae bacterium]|nr:MAG: purine-binding chemotaxis protein CheW [Spirochaetaceae bacterium]
MSAVSKHDGETVETVETLGATAAAQAEAADTEKYLVFSVAEEKYAVEVVRVEEVIEAYGITAVPRTPSYLLGIINLRGRIVPVLCVRRRFGFEAAVTTTDTRLVVLQVRLGEELVSLGAVLDAVHGVVDISPSDIEKRPSLGNSGDQHIAVTSIAKFENELLLVLDADRLLTKEYLDDSYQHLGQTGQTGQTAVG